MNPPFRENPAIPSASDNPDKARGWIAGPRDVRIHAGPSILAMPLCKACQAAGLTCVKVGFDQRDYSQSSIAFHLKVHESERPHDVGGDSSRQAASGHFRQGHASAK